MTVPGVWATLRARFSVPIKTSSEAYPAFYTVGMGLSLLFFFWGGGGAVCVCVGMVGKWLGCGIDHSLFVPLRLKNGYSYVSTSSLLMVCNRELNLFFNLSTLLLFQQLNAVIYFMILLLYQISMKLLACIAYIWKGSGLIFSEVFCGFHHSLQANAGMVVP